jgi:hypothetical protein
MAKSIAGVAVCSFAGYNRVRRLQKHWSRSALPVVRETGMGGVTGKQ